MISAVQIVYSDKGHVVEKNKYRHVLLKDNSQADILLSCFPQSLCELFSPAWLHCDILHHGVSVSILQSSAACCAAQLYPVDLN